MSFRRPLTMEPRWASLLARAAEYCRKLESSAFDFVCREEIGETIDPALDVIKKLPPPNSGWTEYRVPTFTISRVKKIKHSFVYDYQCVRAGRAIREMRTQLEENGKRKVVPNAELKTSLRSVFYNELTSNLDTWKDNFGLLVGGGQDFQKPLVRYFIFGDLLNMLKRGEPMKAFTGYAEMTYHRAAYDVVEPLGFNLQGALYEEGMAKGLSEETLSEVKSNNLVNSLLFEKWQVRKLVGEGNVKGGEIFQASNFLFVNGHGNQFKFGVSGNDIVASGIGGPLMKAILTNTVIPILGGFMGPGGSLSNVGEYVKRAVSNMNLGPSGSGTHPLPARLRGSG